MPVEHALIEASLRTQSAAAAVQPFGPAAQSSVDAQHSIPDPELSAALEVCNHKKASGSRPVCENHRIVEPCDRHCCRVLTCSPTGVSSGQNQLLGYGPAMPVLHVLKSRSHGIASPHTFGPLAQSPALR